MPTLRSPVTDLPGIGPSTAQKLSRLGIRTLVDLISHFPIRHDDFRRITPVSALSVGVPAVVKGKLQLLNTRHGYRRRRMSITEGLFSDRTGTIRVVWFNQPYLATQFKAGDEVYLVGRLADTEYGLQFQSPLVERADDRRHVAGRIVPVYRATAGISQRMLRNAVRHALPLSVRIPDAIPDQIRKRLRLSPLASALREIHVPTAPRALTAARDRLAFGELLPVVLSSMRLERARMTEQAPVLMLMPDQIRSFTASLPFRLTGNQRRAAWEILQDLEKPTPMYRLLEGDVGSGKTVVAATAILSAVLNGMQAAVLVPTDVLAEQHFRTLRSLLGDRTTIGLLTGKHCDWTIGDTPPTKKSMRKAISESKLQVVVGTHALLNQTVRIPKLALVIVDEQHRFGVKQRKSIYSKGIGATPHLLSMTATPIPRTLALTVFGGLRISVLRELPPGRTPVQTELITASDDARAYALIRKRVAAREQAFVICPLIEESDLSGTTAAVSEYERLRSGPLKGLRLGLLHGGLASNVKRETLDTFRRGSIDVLVATPVVEVGVDIPAATVMLIEGAERFGLAQLHQLRGRIGRGPKPSICFVRSDDPRPETLRRLTALVNASDGFSLAEEDLRHRGPGDLYGIRQSGLPSFQMVSFSNGPFLQRVRLTAETLLAEDPELAQAPALRKKADAAAEFVHFE